MVNSALRLRSAVAAVALLAAGSAAAAAAQDVPSDSAIRSIIKERVDSGRSVGIVVGVLQNGKRRYFAYGAAGTSRPLDEHTVFEIGSMSKTFTGLLLADAVVRGEVKLDEPVADLLPGGTVVPTFNGKPITLEELATHRSGLPRLPTNLKPANPSDPYADYTASQLDSFLSTYKLPRAPGDSAEYSNLGFGLLGFALTSKEHATSWGALVQQRITDPLGMRETFVDVPASDEARLAIGHDDRMDVVPPWHFDVLAGAGALRSTASDLLTYLAAELDTANGPLSRAVALGRKPRAVFVGANRIGLAWLVGGTAGNPIWWHDGETGGFASFAAFDPAHRTAIVVLSNAAVPVDDLGTHLIAPVAALHMPAVPPHVPVVSLSDAQMDRVVGAYQFAPTFTITVTRQGDVLYGQPTGQQKFRLWPASPDRFLVHEVNAELDFTLPAAGPATSATLLQNGRTLIGKRQ
jgi:CubicO group peptidase (beta-lactamase class C family)